MQIGIRFAGLNIFYMYAGVEQPRSGEQEEERGAALIFAFVII